LARIPFLFLDEEPIDRYVTGGINSKYSIRDLAISPDNKTLAVGIIRAEKSYVILLDLGNINEPLERPLAATPVLDGMVNSLAFSPDGQFLAVGTMKYKTRKSR
jgi:WD40 repeat protein